MAGEEVVGGIVGFLRLDADEFHREITKAIAEVKALSGMDAKVDVKVDTQRIDSASRATKSLAGGINEVTRANRSLEDASSKVGIAEARLNELRASGKSKASTLMAAESALLKARRAEQDVIFASYQGNIRLSKAERLAANEAEGLGKSLTDVGSSGGPGGPGLMVGGIAAGMVLLGPVTAAASAAMAGFVGVAGTAALAYVGFKKEIEKGTALGMAMQSQVDGLKGAFMALGKTAATAMAGDVIAGMQTMRDFLPSLNDEVGGLASHLGAAFRISTSGLISGLQVAMPLLQDGGVYAERLAQKFADFAQSQDFRDFVAYARAELPQVVEAIASLGGGIKDLTVALAPAGESLIEIINLTGKFASATSTVIGWLGKINEATQAPGQGPGLLERLTSGADTATPAVAAATVQMAAFASIQSPLATGLGTTNLALADATEKHRATATSAAAATLQMQLENNAAGLLKGALDKLNGVNISAAQAQNAFDSSLTNMGTHITTTGKKITFAGSAINNMSASSVALRGQLNSQITSAEGAASAFGQMKGSTEAGRLKLIEMKKQIIENAVAHSVDRKAVTAYVNSLLSIPKTVPPTKLEVATAQAMAGIKAFQTAIDKLHGKSVTASIHYVYTGKLPNGGKSTAGGQTFADGGTVRSKIPGYAGGTVVGPGTGRSDSILAGIAGTGELIRISNGEHISTDASRRRNQAALEAGNHGAKLAVVGGATSGGIDWEAGAALIADRVAAAVYAGSRKGISERDGRMSLATIGGLTTVGQS